MSRTGRFNYLLVLLTFAVSALAIGAAQDHVEPAREPVTAKIKLDERSMIIVPVSINGSRPYDFMLDTGCAKTIIDQKLADQLGLPRTAEKTVVGVLASTRMSVASVDSMSVAGAVVSGGEIFTTAHAPTVTGNVRGVLGEDFLTKLRSAHRLSPPDHRARLSAWIYSADGGRRASPIAT